MHLAKSAWISCNLIFITVVFAGCKFLQLGSDSDTSSTSSDGDKATIEYCTHGHDGELPSALMDHFPNNKYSHDFDQSIETELLVGLHYEGLGIDASVVHSTKFQVHHELSVDVVFAYHAPNNNGSDYPMPEIFVKEDPGEVFNYWLDGRDVFVAKCTYALSVSTDTSTKEQLTVMGNGGSSTQSELDTVTRSTTIPVKLEKGDTLDVLYRLCDETYNKADKQTLENEIKDEIAKKFRWRQNTELCPWVDETGYMWLIPNCEVDCTAANESNLNCARLGWVLGQEGEPYGPGKGRYKCEKDICLHKIGP